ncbi:MAG: hypothetical protein Q4E47_00020 [Candidatus Saccharibacteria bacterium]|nr:hypothetical protein [Candidatus Saccharibacteria bacterium]
MPEETAETKKTRIYIILGVIAAITTILILMLVISMTSGKTLTCTETNDGLYLFADEDGNDVTFDSKITYTINFNNKDDITSAKIEKTYSSENSKAVENLSNLSKFTSENQYVENFKNETKGNDVNIKYSIKSEAFKLSMEEFYNSGVSDHLGLYGYYDTDDEFETEFRYEKLSDYLTYKNLKAEYESSSNITCR